MAKVKQLGVSDVQGEVDALLQQGQKQAVPTRGDATIYLLELLGQGLGALSGNEQVAQFSRQVKSGNDAIRMEEVLGQLARGEEPVVPFGLSAENQQRLTEQVQQKKALQAKVVLDLLGQKQGVENTNAQMEQQETLFDKGQKADDTRLDKTHTLQRDLARDEIAAGDRRSKAQLDATYAGIEADKVGRAATLKAQAEMSQADNLSREKIASQAAGSALIQELLQGKRLRSVAGAKAADPLKNMDNLRELATLGIGEVDKEGKETLQNRRIKLRAAQLLQQIMAGQATVGGAALGSGISREELLELMEKE